MRFLELLYGTRVALFAAFCSFLQLFATFTSFCIFCIFLHLLQFFAIFGSFRSHKIMICIFHCCLETEYGIIFHFIPCYTYFFVIFALLCQKCGANFFFIRIQSILRVLKLLFGTRVARSLWVRHEKPSPLCTTSFSYSKFVEVKSTAH